MESEESERAPFLKQHSAPLIGGSALLRQFSVPIHTSEESVTRKTQSDGDRAVLFPDSTSPRSDVLMPKRSHFNRMRGLTSFRHGKDKVELNLDAHPTNRLSDLGEIDPIVNLSVDEFKRITDRGIGYFNLNPKIGIKFLKDQRIIYNRRDSADLNIRRVALFLKNTRGLNKTKIGQYLASDLAVLNEYLATFDFKGYDCSAVGVEAGLREVLSHFRPPGEAQQIDRVLDCFAARFALYTKEPLTKDLVHQLAFVIILLNVTLHHPNVRGKTTMTRDQFVKIYFKEPSLKGAFSREDLAELYDQVSKKEIRYEEDREDLLGNLFTDPDRAGWLEIRIKNAESLFPRIQNRWVKRWVVLSQHSLYYFRKSTDVEFEGFIPVENLRLLTEQNSASSPEISTRELPGSHEVYRPPSPSRQVSDRIRRARLVSCPSFGTSQSSINTGATSASSSLHNSILSAFQTSRPPYQNFLLAPIDSTVFVKSARLSKTRSKKNNGEMKSQKNRYIAFRTRSKEEFTDWIKALRESGVQSRFFLPGTLKSPTKLFKNRMRSMASSIPSSFSAEINDDIGDKLGSSYNNGLAIAMSDSALVVT